MTDVTVVGNGAHATGAPLSLLAILERRPPAVSLRTVLLGGGPLVDRYRAVSDHLEVLAIPEVRGLRPRRVAQEVGLATQLRRATQPRSPGEVLVVNTIEYEAALLRARTWPSPARVMIREGAGHAAGPRGRARVRLLRSASAVGLAAVGDRQAEEWRTRLGRDVVRRMNIYDPGQPSADATATGPVRFLVVGGTSPVKGVDLAVKAYRAMARRAEARLVVASGDFEPHQDEGVVWTGYVADLAGQMGRHADVLVGASRTEPFARAVVEAAFAGLPTVAWDTGGYPEQVALLGGRLVPPFDAAALAGAMDDLVREGRPSIAARGAEARRRALAHFDPAAAATSWWDWILG